MVNPVNVFPGPVLAAAFVSLPASTVVFYEVFYEFEYTSDGKLGPLLQSIPQYMNSAAQFFPNVENYIREVLSKKEEKKEEKKVEEHVEKKEEEREDKESFFGSIARHVKNAINSPLGEMILSGISSIFFSTHHSSLKVFKRGNNYIVETPCGNRFMRPDEVENYYLEQATLRFNRVSINTEHHSDPPEHKFDSYMVSPATSIASNSSYFNIPNVGKINSTSLIPRRE
jgi:hypothetical protein